MLHYDDYCIGVFDEYFIHIIISYAKGNINRCNSSETELLSSEFRSINFDLDLKDWLYWPKFKNAICMHFANQNICFLAWFYIRTQTNNEILPAYTQSDLHYASLNGARQSNVRKQNAFLLYFRFKLFP